jgi:hypothetical protein
VINTVHPGSLSTWDTLKSTKQIREGNFNYKVKNKILHKQKKKKTMTIYAIYIF